MTLKETGWENMDQYLPLENTVTNIWCHAMWIICQLAKWQLVYQKDFTPQS